MVMRPRGAVEYPLGPGGKKAQAAVFDQIARVPRHAVRFEIGGRCAQQALERAQGFIDDPAERMRERADGNVKTFRDRIDRPVDQHDFQFQPRIFRLESAEHIGKPGDGQRCRRLDAQVIDQIMVLLAHARQKIADISHHAACAMHIALACFRQSQLPGRAMEQHSADLSFELRDTFGHDRGRDIEFARRGRKPGGLGGGQKSLKIDERIHLLFSIRES